MSTSRFDLRFIGGICFFMMPLAVAVLGAYFILDVIVETIHSASELSKVTVVVSLVFLIITALCFLSCAAGICAAIFPAIKDCASNVLSDHSESKIAPSPTSVVEDGPPPVLIAPSPMSMVEDSPPPV